MKESLQETEKKKRGLYSKDGNKTVGTANAKSPATARPKVDINKVGITCVVEKISSMGGTTISSKPCPREQVDRQRHAIVVVVSFKQKVLAEPRQRP